MCADVASSSVANERSRAIRVLVARQVTTQQEIRNGEKEKKKRGGNYFEKIVLRPSCFMQSSKWEELKRNKLASARAVQESCESSCRLEIVVS